MITPPLYLSGEKIKEQIDYYDVQNTISHGGNLHVPENMSNGYMV